MISMPLVSFAQSGQNGSSEASAGASSTEQVTAQVTAQKAAQIFELEETIQLALEQSPLSRAAKYSLVASQYRYKSFRADLLPSLDLSGDVPNYNRRLSTRLADDGSTQFIATKQSNAKRNTRNPAQP